MDFKNYAAEKQRSILEAAISLFMKYTVSKTSMDEIAAAARVSKVTVYKYFHDKNGLYLSVYLHITDAYNSEISRQVNGAASVIKKMSNYISVCTAFIGSGHLKLCEELSDINAEVHERFESFHRGSEKLIIQLIAEAKEEGLLRANIDDDAIFHYINMGLSYFRHDERYRSRMQNDLGFKEAFMKLLFQNIFNDCQALE